VTGDELKATLDLYYANSADALANASAAGTPTFGEFSFKVAADNDGVFDPNLVATAQAVLDDVATAAWSAA